MKAGTDVKKRFGRVWRADITIGLIVMMLMALMASGCRRDVGEQDWSFVPDPRAEIDPTKTYTIELWDYDLPIFWAEGNYQTFVNEVIASFTEIYPNVQIVYRLLDYETGPEELSETLGGGTPPDLYMSFGPHHTLDPRLQLPVDGYLSEEDLAAFEPLALSLLSYKAGIWGWPRWLAVEAWAGNRALLEEAGADIEMIQQKGWTWEEFIGLAETARHEKSHVYGLVTNPKPTLLFNHIMRGCGASAVFFTGEGAALYEAAAQERPEGTEGGEGGEGAPPAQEAAPPVPGWSPGQIETALDLMIELRDKGLLPLTGRAFERPLEYFWEHRTMAMAGFGTWVWHQSAWRQKRIDDKDLYPAKGNVDVVMLPIPHLEGQAVAAPVTCAALIPFRQAEYKGDDHTRVVMAFAKHFVTGMGAWPAAELGHVPPLVMDQQLWHQEIQLDDANGRFIVDYCRQGLAPFGADPTIDQAETEFRQAVLTPALEGFIGGDIEPEELVKRLTKGLDRLDPVPRDP